MRNEDAPCTRRFETASQWQSSGPTLGSCAQRNTLLGPDERKATQKHGAPRAAAATPRRAAHPHIAASRSFPPPPRHSDRPPLHKRAPRVTKGRAEQPSGPTGDVRVSRVHAHVGRRSLGHGTMHDEAALPSTCEPAHNALRGFTASPLGSPARGACSNSSAGTRVGRQDPTHLMVAVRLLVLVGAAQPDAHHGGGNNPSTVAAATLTGDVAARKTTDRRGARIGGAPAQRPLVPWLWSCGRHGSSLSEAVRTFLFLFWLVPPPRLGLLGQGLWLAVRSALGPPPTLRAAWFSLFSKRRAHGGPLAHGAALRRGCTPHLA